MKRDKRQDFKIWVFQVKKILVMKKLAARTEKVLNKKKKKNSQIMNKLEVKYNFNFYYFFNLYKKFILKIKIKIFYYIN